MTSSREKCTFRERRVRADARMAPFARQSVVSRRNGFTLLEVVVSVALFVMLFIGTWEIAGVFVNSVHSDQVAADVDFAVRRVFNLVSEDLRDSGADEFGTDYVTSHPFTASTVAPAITFQKRIDYTGVPANDWGTPITFSLVASPGENPTNSIDDDDDGLVDEQHLVRTQDGVTDLLSTNVVQLSFSRQTGEFKIDFQLTIRRSVRLDAQFLNRVLNGTVALRNKG